MDELVFKTYSLDPLTKGDLEGTLTFSAEIPPEEIHISTEFSEKTPRLETLCSLALIAESSPGGVDYLIGYIAKATLSVIPGQPNEITINHPLVEREQKDFRKNPWYTGYHVLLFSPPEDIGEFLERKRLMAPWAVPDHPYVENSS